MSSHDLSAQFAHFAGREVRAKEHTEMVEVGDMSYPFTEVHLAKNDPAVKELTAAAKAAGLQLRLLIPGMAYTTDYRQDRLNATVAKATDGKYRFSPSFTIG